jgi:putative endonuclease
MSTFYYIYILESQKDGNWYTGYTEDLQSRFERHQAGKVKSTKHRRPLKLIYFEGCKSQDDAIRREKYLKTHYGKMFLKKRLKSYFTGQENKNQESKL